MTTLHTINKSPFEKNSLEQCFGRLIDGNAVLLIEDAVYAATAGTSFESRVADTCAKYPVFVLTPDLKARGLGDATLVAGVERVDYNGFVELTTQYERVHAWL